jgi:hypothetical protein
MELSGQFHAPAALRPEKYCDTDRKEDCLGPRAGLDIFGEEKNILNKINSKYHNIYLYVFTLYLM